MNVRSGTNASISIAFATCHLSKYYSFHILLVDFQIIIIMHFMGNGKAFCRKCNNKQWHHRQELRIKSKYKKDIYFRIGVCVCVGVCRLWIPFCFDGIFIFPFMSSYSHCSEFDVWTIGEFRLMKFDIFHEPFFADRISIWDIKVSDCTVRCVLCVSKWFCIV